MESDFEAKRVSWDDKSDEELFVEYCEGNMTAMEALLGRIGRPLYRTILRQVGNRAVAEDIFQDSLERIVRHRTRFDPERSFRAWAWTIAARRCTDYFRRQGREVGLEDPDSGQSPQADPERTAMGRESIARFAKALFELPEQQREVFLMREEAGLSFARISESSGRPLGTVLSQMSSALKKLRKAVEE